MALLASLALVLALQESREGQESPHPEAAPWGKVERPVIEVRDGVRLMTELALADPDPETPFIVLYHQARSSRGEYRPIVPRLRALGYDCLSVDLRSGKGSNGVTNLTAKAVRESGGNPDYLDALVDIEDSLAWARANHAKGKLIAWGSSYSASLVLHVAGTRPELVDGVLAFAPGEYFSSLGKGSTWIRDSARSIRCPAFLTSARAEKDELAPILEALPGAVGFIPESEGAHGSSALWEESPGQEEYWRAVEAFLAAHFPARAAPGGPREPREPRETGDK